VVGGGVVAERKVRSLLDAGARVTVISPEITPALAAWTAEGAITHRARGYQRGDLEGFFLAYAATDDELLQVEVARDAEAAGVLVNVVDRPQLCSFIVPSILARGELTVAVSTGGGSPALARHVRERIEAVLGPEYEAALQVLTRLREQLHDLPLAAAERRRIFAELIESELLEHLRDGDIAAVDRVLARCAGEGVSLATLGVTPNE
jgi:precorrin-2 dehydrogenase/sirohydrochlorin ferrochelatase